MRIGMLCSGGDSPGMNACCRAIARSAISQGLDVVGINRGYQGLIDEDFYSRGPRGTRAFNADDPSDQAMLFTTRTVSDWSRYGGAFLLSSRSEEFQTKEGMEKAATNLKKHGIDALIPIGGNGTLTGAIELAKSWEGQIVGCPGTIDNDLCGTDYTIGFSTAVNTAVEAVDKIRDTAESHERMFLVEVMGRHSGYIAIDTALACGAEVVAIPETKTNIPEIVNYLNVLRGRGKNSVLMIVSEGDEEGNAFVIDEKLKNAGNPFQSRVVVLGHLQRGGRPTPEDRRRATQIGCGAVNAIANGKTGIMIGSAGEQVTETSLHDAVMVKRNIPVELVRLMEEMAK